MAAVGAIAGGVMGMMQASYQAKVANMNAEIAGENAQRALQRGGIEGEDNDFQTKALLGEQEVAQAASGVSLSGKSQILTRKSARILGRRDTLNILQDADMEAYNFRVQQANFKAEAKAAKMSGIAGMIGGVLNAAGSVSGSSLVGGAKSTASQYNFIPKPLAKPTSVSTYVGGTNPLMKGRLNRGML